MELAIPLVALGGLYVISNQKKETFKNKPQIQYPNSYSKPIQENKHFTPPSEINKIHEYTDLAGRKQNLDDQTTNMVPFFGKQKNIGHSMKSNYERDYSLDN